jgi:hypothetical protein
MSERETAPFSKPKSKRWVWIVPSIFLHLAILIIWLLLPESEPRRPGERELTIKEDQAEALQRHVEDANLEALQSKISELQSIKAAMVRIRDEKMVHVIDFERSMVDEAPRDVATLLGELAGVYESVYDTYLAIRAAVDMYAEQMPPIREAADIDTIAGIRALPRLESFYNRFDGVSDHFEVAFYETGSIVRAIDIKLEWINESQLAERVEALAPQMETTFSTHRDAFESIPYSWKREASFRELTDNMEERIAEVEAFRKSESEGQAEIARKRAELSEKIAEAEAGLAQTIPALESAEIAFGGLNRNENREAWLDMRKSVRDHRQSKQALEKSLRDANKMLTRTTHRPDHQLSQRVNRIESRLEHALPPAPDRGLLTRAMTEQQTIILHLEELVKSMEEPE